MFLHGGRIVARALRREGVSHLFTLCGGHIQPIYDGCLDEEIRVVDVRHEQSAAHAADGWARVTGRPGVAAVTAGPGVTDAVTAVANAQRAQSPLVLLGGQGARLLGPFGGQDRGALQDMNHVDLLRPITKWAVSVPEARRIPDYVQSAFRIATTGVPGPVFLELPLEILMGGCRDRDLVEYPGYRSEARPWADPRAVEQAAGLLRAAERPALVVGSQLRWTAWPEALAAFLAATPMPTFLNGMARGALPRSHPCHFQRVRTKAMSEADLVILVGTPLDFRMGYGEKIGRATKLVQIDLDGAEIGRNRTVDVGVVADAGAALLALREAIVGLGAGAGGGPERGAWLRHVAAADAAAIARTRAQAESDEEPVNPLRLCAEVNRFVDAKTIVVGDGGDFVATAAYLLDVEGPGSWLDPGPLGTLGVGPGYAMAAKLAKPDHRVILMLGDGSFGFNGMEFESMARQSIPVVGIVGNDAAWTQILRAQVAAYGRDRVVATQLDYTRYDKVVEGLGGHGEYVERLADLRPALERAFGCGRPALVNVKVGGSDFRKDALSL
jgi:acetolactate synthase-1/2/3 large subunit